jgi:hypothetical protein
LVDNVVEHLVRSLNLTNKAQQPKKVFPFHQACSNDE